MAAVVASSCGKPLEAVEVLCAADGSDDLMARGEEFWDQSASEESGAAGKKDVHDGSLYFACMASHWSKVCLPKRLPGWGSSVPSRMPRPHAPGMAISITGRCCSPAR